MGEAILSGGLIAYVTARLTIDRQKVVMWLVHRGIAWVEGDRARIAAKAAAMGKRVELVGGVK